MRKSESPQQYWVAAGFAGLVAAASLFSVAQLLSVFFAVPAAPLNSMGSAFIDLTPVWLKDFVISIFGTNDKLVLKLSMALVVVIAAFLIGMLAQRSFTAAAGSVAVLGIGVAAAILSRTGASAGDLTPLVIGIITGLLVLKWLSTVARSVFATHESTFDTARTTTTRRQFVLFSSLTIVGSLLATGLSRYLSAARDLSIAARESLRLPAPKLKASPIPRNAQIEIAGMPQFLTPNTDFYRIDTALTVPQIDPARWSLKVHGMVEHEVTLSFAQLLEQELVESYLTLTCVSNPVGGDLVGNAKWLGYPLRLLLEQAVPLPGADMVLSTSSDGFTASTPLEVLTDHRMALLAVGMNGQPLPFEHGFPVRMVVPGLYGYVSATKWVVDLEVTRFADKVAYWSTRGWSEHGPIKLASRVDVPRNNATVAANNLALGGTAWAQTRGIAAVELSLDDGPWVKTELGDEVSVDTWRQWRYLWESAPAGQHSVKVRAIDTHGEIQSGDIASPAPNGASGWHQIHFTVR
ncbi:oxidoreductase [Arthrobacter sp. MYb227]|uniref:molybdopterin-dependent oxidoreductase n=1 Tax=Arthrobacter sp. MYb227 TaxID=1848601 RepID=UPI000CFC1330|nr:molybdopterin-dependent oxidoreductase [Arthrobacter sp. MYb227]PQZ91586.1 oxidoreductase [Arthrobacter sp. MYb227]